MGASSPRGAVEDHEEPGRQVLLLSSGQKVCTFSSI